MNGLPINFQTLLAALFSLLVFGGCYSSPVPLEEVPSQPVNPEWLGEWTEGGENPRRMTVRAGKGGWYEIDVVDRGDERYKVRAFATRVGGETIVSFRASRNRDWNFARVRGRGDTRELALLSMTGFRAKAGTPAALREAMQNAVHDDDAFLTTRTARRLQKDHRRSGRAAMGPITTSRIEAECPGAKVHQVTKVDTEIVGGYKALMARLRYPEADRRAGRGGTVLLEYVVGADGTVIEAWVLDKDFVGRRTRATEAMRAEALRLVRSARFRPGRTEEGQAVCTITNSFTVEFTAPGEERRFTGERDVRASFTAQLKHLVRAAPDGFAAYRDERISDADNRNDIWDSKANASYANLIPSRRSNISSINGMTSGTVVIRWGETGHSTHRTKYLAGDCKTCEADWFKLASEYITDALPAWVSTSAPEDVQLGATRWWLECPEGGGRTVQLTMDERGGVSFWVHQESEPTACAGASEE